MTGGDTLREWSSLLKRHEAFWSCGPADRPLIGVTYDYVVDAELIASVIGDGELPPHKVDIRPFLPVYDRIAAAREAIGDDMIGVADSLYGIPWLEAICGSHVMISDGKSIWPEPPEDSGEIEDVASWSPTGVASPWFQKLLATLQTLVDHVGNRYALGISHLRGPADVLVALLGSERFFLSFFDKPELIHHLARQAASIWIEVAQAQAKIIPAYRGGYGTRFYGLWSPGRAAWLQDDTSVMVSLKHYREFFLEPVRSMSVFPYGVFHLHIPAKHVAKTVATLPNVRAVNLTFDAPDVTVQQAMPLLQDLQARGVPLILTKDIDEGFSLEEYDEIADGLSARGLCVHMRAGSVEEGRAVMAHVTETASVDSGS